MLCLNLSDCELILTYKVNTQSTFYENVNQIITECSRLLIHTVNLIKTSSNVF